MKGTRKIGKKDMVHNSLCPKIEVDPETYEVRADGELLTCEPAQVAADGATVFPVLMPPVVLDREPEAERRDLLVPVDLSMPMTWRSSASLGATR